VSLDHFATTECGERIHPDYCAAILGDRDGQHVKGAVRVTHGLGCPRRAVIEHVEDYAVDPLDCNAMLTGTAWHSLMERYGRPGTVEVSVAGNLATPGGSVAVAGRSDCIVGEHVHDHKHIGDDKLRYKLREGATPEHRVQLSLYAELRAQGGHERPSKGVIWYHTSKAGKDALTPMPVELLPIDEALAHPPYGGAYTVAELYAQADEGFRTGEWRTLPLAGQTQKFGYRVACDYCAVRGICMTAENGAPF
jgi:hypothetical protein